MDRGLRDNKLESLRRCIERIKAKRPDSPDSLREDYDLQDILAVNLQRAVQLSVDLAVGIIAGLDVPAPETMARGFDILADQGVISELTARRMKKAVGLRNIAVHQYCEVDWDIVFNVAHKNVEDFEQYAREIIQATELEKGN